MQHYATEICADQMSRFDQDINHYLCMIFQRKFKKYQLVCIKKK